MRQPAGRAPSPRLRQNNGRRRGRHPRQIFRRFLDTTARVTIAADQVTVQLPRRAHNPLLLDAGFIGQATKIPWWDDRKLRIEIV